MDNGHELTPEDLERARELSRVPDLLVVPIVAGILAQCLIRTSGCTIEDMESRAAAVARARRVAMLATERRHWRKAPELALATVLRFVEEEGTNLQPWNAGGLAYYALELHASAPQKPAEYVERFRQWYEQRQPSLLETVLLAIDCAGRISPTPGVSLHLLGRAAKPLRLMLMEPFRARLGGSWERALAWSYSEYTVETLSYFALNLSSTSTALAYKLNGIADMVRQACAERDEAIAEQERLEEAEVERRAAARAEEQVNAAEARADAALAEHARAVEEAQALRSERDRLSARLAGALSRIESLEAQFPSVNRPVEEVPAAAPRLAPAEPVAPPDAPPTLAGERVLVFTNQERAGVREEIRASFEALGPEGVDVIDVSRSHGPPSYPPGAIVVADITFMPHAAYEAVKARAARSECRFIALRGGSATLAERAAAWVATGRPPE
jgi:hypothetical protein